MQESEVHTQDIAKVLRVTGVGKLLKTSPGIGLHLNTSQSAVERGERVQAIALV